MVDIISRAGLLSAPALTSGPSRPKLARQGQTAHPHPPSVAIPRSGPGSSPGSPAPRQPGAAVRRVCWSGQSGRRRGRPKKLCPAPPGLRRGLAAGEAVRAASAGPVRQGLMCKSSACITSGPLAGEKTMLAHKKMPKRPTRCRADTHQRASRMRAPPRDQAARAKSPGGRPGLGPCNEPTHGRPRQRRRSEQASARDYIDHEQANGAEQFPLSVCKRISSLGSTKHEHWRTIS